MSLYYDRAGNPLTFDEALKPENWSMEARRVALDHTDIRTVSTVHLIHNHRYNDGPPLIFETMVFDRWGEDAGIGRDYHCERYSTEAEAVAGHAAILARAQAGEWS